eukprot:TRINITY_DN2042_c0_g1_i2.p1 TRINITY_DN2042_c0_g1~~TRINITY_DN2042_c0_g1_i2.p1  ORF type:complete len:151 (+),score=21.65 TRINITY_DN2042_c0_g1_i2:831-1283(+)
MDLAILASKRSNCMKRRVGAVLVKDNLVVSTGYNGTPRNTTNCNEGGCPRCNGNARAGIGLEDCFCLHAEENALIIAGGKQALGGTIYCCTCPCLKCACRIVQAGIVRVVYSLAYGMDETSAGLFRQAKVQLCQISLPESFASSCPSDRE